MNVNQHNCTVKLLLSGHVALEEISPETKKTIFYLVEESPDREMGLLVCNDLTQHLRNE